MSPDEAALMAELEGIVDDASARIAADSCDAAAPLALTPDGWVVSLSPALADLVSQMVPEMTSVLESAVADELVVGVLFKNPYRDVDSDDTAAMPDDTWSRDHVPGRAAQLGADVAFAFEVLCGAPVRQPELFRVVETMAALRRLLYATFGPTVLEVDMVHPGQLFTFLAGSVQEAAMAVEDAAG